MNKRIEWIDGLKGIACLCVFWHHFMLAFFPAYYFGDKEVSHISNNFDVGLAQHPLSVVFNGNYFVAIFCMLSGFVLALQVMKLDDKRKIADIMLKRYFRFMLPVVPTVLVVYVLLQIGGFYNTAVSAITKSLWLGQYYLEKIPFVDCLQKIFVTIWFQGDWAISNAFWVFNQLFQYSYLAIILAMIAWGKNKKILWIYLGAMLIFVRLNTFGVAFVLGVILAYGYFYFDFKPHVLKGIIALCIGVVLGGYPSGVAPTNLYRWIDFLPEWLTTYQFWHIVGAFFTIYGIYNIKIIQKILSSKPLQGLGRISYSVFIIHIPILFSVGCWVFLQMDSMGVGYLKNTLFVFCLCNVMVLLIALLHERYVERNSYKVISKVVATLHEKTEN